MLRVDSLAISFGQILAVRDVSFSVAPGECLAVVGESGSGKSLSALAILGLLPAGAAVTRGSITFTDPVDGSVIDPLHATPTALQRLRGGRIAMIFQEPMSCLNPVFTVGEQLLEAFALHRRDIPHRERTHHVEEALRSVGISEPQRRRSQFSHELSGGMRQRIMIAMAVACQPALLIADEPTTALDATIQAQVLDLIDTLRKPTATSRHSAAGMGVLLITHDLGIAHRRADRIVVLRHGRVVETNTSHSLISNPQHPYTRALLACRPDRATPGSILPTVADADA